MAEKEWREGYPGRGDNARILNRLIQEWLGASSRRCRPGEIWKKLPKRDANRVRKAAERLADSALRDMKRPRGGNPPAYRLRIGIWRVIIEQAEDGIRIRRVLHGREAGQKSSWARLELPGDGGRDDPESVEASVDAGRWRRSLSAGWLAEYSGKTASAESTQNLLFRSS